MNKLSNYNLFAFILGRETKIALLELESVLRRFDFCFDVLSVSHNVAVIKIEKAGSCPSRLGSQAEAEKFEPRRGPIGARSLISILGGTVKIFEIVGEADKNLADQISRIVRDNKGEQMGKINFGISDYQSNKTLPNNINKLGLVVKNALKKSQNTRFVALKEERELAPIVSFKNKLDTKGIEIGLFDQGVGKLVAVTNPEEWSKRDYGKPKGDKYSGMTPPKLARMLVNITLSHVMTKSETGMTKKCPNDQSPNSDFGIRDSSFERVVADPFCGSGNILMEAVMMGREVVGSDISEKAVEDTKANLEWLEQNFQFSIFNFQSNSNDQIPNSKQIFQADATSFDFSKVLTVHNSQLTAIVTEPYLGQPKKFAPSLNAARGEYQKVKNLYINFLKNISRCHSGLDPESTVRGSRNKFGMTLCVIFPLVKTQEGKQFSLYSECIDEIKKIGYTLIREPLVYGREYQIVKREIVLLNLKSQTSNLKTTSLKL